MKQVLFCFSLLCSIVCLDAQSTRIDHPEFGKVWTKAHREPLFTRVNGDVNLQKHFSDYFEKNKLIPPGFNALVILTFVVTKKGEAFFSKAYSSDPSVDLSPLKLEKAVDLMNDWIPATDAGEEVHFQVMLSLKFDDNGVAMRRMSF